MSLWPAIPPTAKDIIRESATGHGLDVADFYSQIREANYVSARRTAARRLRERGYSIKRISRCLRCSEDTTRNYFENYSEQKSNYYAAKGILRKLSPEAQQIIQQRAKIENVTIGRLMTQWVEERAAVETIRVAA
jgi:transposase